MIFILDNFDSFTFNLYQYFGELGEEVLALRRDQCTIEDIEDLRPELIVISPGPCAPRDAQFTLTVIDYFKGKVPILGVCLGHQAIGEIFGGEVIRAKAPVHGKVSQIHHDGQGVFFQLPNPLTVTRYHSLALHRESLPEELLITAETADGEIMGIRHRESPIEGVQFHPEAILTEKGHDLLENAVKNARSWWKAQHNSPWIIQELDIDLQPIELLEAFEESEYPFFLDSGKNYAGLGRYSFMGAFPFLQASAYGDAVEVKRFDTEGGGGKEGPSPLIWQEWLAYPEGESLKILDDLVERYQVSNPTEFPFVGGAVGFWTYDLKDELEEMPQSGVNDLDLPLWRFSWYDGILAYDHESHRYTLLACGMTGSGECRRPVAQARMDRLFRVIEGFLEEREWQEGKEEAIGNYQGYGGSKDMGQLHDRVHHTVSKEQYLLDLQRVIDYIYAGDIYQANLTQRFQIPYTREPLELYKALHAHNPAPFAAFLPYEDFQILSSSPERFVQINARGEIETRPIKGTRPRGKTPEEDEAYARELTESTKDRAELTMIIDLQRNDLGRICRYGSVKVTDLIRLEQYPTVWHLVSTIVGKLKPNLKVSEILKAIFPGGSITGAPKIRAMEIIDELEPYKRGLYTGSIGYIGFDGAWDTNIVIRTILLKDGQAYFNGGGGIVADSVPEEEYEESLQKVKALIKVLSGGC
ncbi:aminodeoxychorismate synthase, component I [Desulfitobacterium dehalogenans ATCC 51507]|uniref:aminodeoxychorismate synthase n=1 Tax=Desulfitobacterium dehalogenans (strain ATCC 51507 / DSM 9161 / JW/IU-DC1) TaxID=756499 RepID=I4ADQ5_DESDJ|nr:aminodeoxychorismate synthase component I [Desulfitobacterium dehalogenans]AFM02090.1 aminodeoxychorismate synthase, component I [Desulfitobacterium dehalogenans ATCC 51507]